NDGPDADGDGICDAGELNWFDLAWDKRRALVIDNSAQSQGLVDFPVLIRLDATRIDYGLTQPGGLDLRFTDAGGTLLSHEVEHWDPGGESVVWVRVPLIPGGSTTETLFMYYDNPAATNAEDPAGVWSNGYAAVWHLHDDLLDSTPNANDGTNQGSTDTLGQIGDGQFFDGASHIDMGSSPSLELTGTLTLEAWVAISNPESAVYSRVLSKKGAWNAGAGYNLEYRASTNWVTSLGSGSNWARADSVDLDTNWHYLSTTFSGTTGTIYVDGVDRTTDSTVTPVAANTQPLLLGRLSGGGSHWSGALDEIRISNVVRSPDWTAAQYLSMTDTFLAFGSEEIAP
ncbi:MAG: DUF2341 domain-containing protein, partial [Gammaproteobacteria bacterium]|nr:DUF2341 domain-containing protein [Gammaproteobacteria bacterium]